ncbi:MAG: TIR domain-containing protein [Candidatus Rokubacteria bacterium]|nr:TIR domain-containing protein [Candidatus Rokubacteria bacterium]
MPKVFISYRREDSQDVTGRIYDRLTRSVSPGDIFRDIDSIPAGMDFRRVLEDAVGRSDVVLVVIGPRWVSAADEQGKRRLENSSDFVRIEVEAALRRGIPIIPVSVSNAALPVDSDLPETMKDLAFRNGRSVRPDPDFHNDMARLIRDIEAVVPGMAASVAGGTALRSPALVFATAVIVIASVLYLLLKRPDGNARPAVEGPRSSQAGDRRVRPTATVQQQPAGAAVVPAPGSVTPQAPSVAPRPSPTSETPPEVLEGNVVADLRPSRPTAPAVQSQLGPKAEDLVILQGILADGAGFKAIVNDEVVGKGETVAGVMVVRITSREVTFLHGGRRFVKRLEP